MGRLREKRVRVVVEMLLERSECCIVLVLNAVNPKLQYKIQIDLRS